MDGRLIIRNERVETDRKIVSENPATLEPGGEVSVAAGEICEPCETMSAPCRGS
jgi:hypothetical protein